MRTHQRTGTAEAERSHVDPFADCARNMFGVLNLPECCLVPGMLS
jgi:hypothetical protein